MATPHLHVPENTRERPTVLYLKASEVGRDGIHLNWAHSSLWEDVPQVREAWAPPSYEKGTHNSVGS